MIKFTTKCIFEEGLHARPASELVKICQTSKADIKIIKDGSETNPKSILGLMSLRISFNDEIDVEILGEDEGMIASSIKAFFDQV